MEDKEPASEKKAPRTLFNYMSEIYSNENTIEEWFSWPPDIFALTSIILDTSGWYRLVVDGSGAFKNFLIKTSQNSNCNGVDEDDFSGKGHNIKCWINNPNWTDDLQKLGNAWRAFIDLMPSCFDEIKKVYESDVTDPNKVKALDKLLDANKGLLTTETPPKGVVFLVFLKKSFGFWDATQRYSLSHLIEDEEILFSHKINLKKDIKEKIQFIVDVIDLFSIADQISCNMGIVKYSENNSGTRDLSANSQLLMEGTLSHIDKVHGVVLPKLRLPKVGLSLRSMSQHLAFVKSEVDVIWRTMPWMNFDENTLNILVITKADRFKTVLVQTYFASESFLI
jgi:hypothetical protein